MHRERTLSLGFVPVKDTANEWRNERDSGLSTGNRLKHIVINSIQGKASLVMQKLGELHL